MRFRLIPLVLISAVSLQFSAEAYALVPNDLNSQQWFLSHPTTPILGIRAPEAWEIYKGRDDVVVGLITGGIFYNHPDLDPGNRSRILQGTDVGNNDGDPYEDPAPCLAVDTEGTSMAGVIAALTDNGLNADGQGVAGIMWKGSNP